MTPTVYIITAQTNLHPGAGDANYGIIDKLVQRDPVNGLPVIHASSLKGAILQHFYHQTGMSDGYIDVVFGGQTSVNKRKSGIKRDSSKTGEFIFMQAQLLSIPVRANGNTPFYRISSPSVLREFAGQLVQTGALNDKDALYAELQAMATAGEREAIILGNPVQSVRLEDLKPMPLKTYANASPNIITLLGDLAVIIPDVQLQQLTDNHHLPVIARNHLENGQSTNLWYEQVLPRQTRFAFLVLEPEQPNIEQGGYDGNFSHRLTTNGLVQIGANASVGYGFCQITPFQCN